jgi:hypothetical protein
MPFSAFKFFLCVCRFFVGCHRAASTAGLPDGLFSNQKSQFGKNFQGLRLENNDIFYGQLEHFMDIWDIL